VAQRILAKKQQQQRNLSRSRVLDQDDDS
jgi:hypothetical protein